jgi:hypothetical protein
MDVNTARIIIAQIQGGFKDLKVPFISEGEMLNCKGFTDAIKFRSWLEKNKNLAEIISSVYIPALTFQAVF